MKHKVKKVKPARTLEERLAGIATWRVTGGDKKGERVTVEFYGTREQAEKLFEEKAA